MTPPVAVCVVCLGFAFWFSVVFGIYLIPIDYVLIEKLFQVLMRDANPRAKPCGLEFALCDVRPNGALLQLKDISDLLYGINSEVH